MFLFFFDKIHSAGWLFWKIATNARHDTLVEFQHWQQWLIDNSPMCRQGSGQLPTLNICRNWKILKASWTV